MKNAGWLFYRDYYNSLTDAQIKNFVSSGELGIAPKEGFFKVESDALLDFKWDNGQNSAFHPGTQQFPLETTYPGLLVGSGYSHQTGSMGEFKAGFFFDHTTGLPVIPGSSVKGLLRSAFPGRESRAAVKIAKIEFIKEQLAEVQAGLDDMDVIHLEKQIFEGKENNGDYLPMHKHDVFLDAFIIKTEDKDKKRIFADDYITPHSDPLKNPVPVRFLKIRPEVTFQFNFVLQKSEIGPLTLEAENKAKLFENILKIFGIGAKTNVGYGQFKD